MFKNIFTFILFTLVVQKSFASQKRDKRFVEALTSWLAEQIDPADRKPIVILPIPQSEHYAHPGQNFAHTGHRVPTVEGIISTSTESTQFDTNNLVGGLNNISPLALIGSLHRLASKNGFAPSPEITRAALRLLSNKEGLNLAANIINAGIISPYKDSLVQLADDDKDRKDGQASGVVEVTAGESIKQKFSNLKPSKHPFKLPIPNSHVKIIKSNNILGGNSIRKHRKHRMPFTYTIQTRLIPTGLTPALHTVKHKPTPPKEVHVIHVEKVTTAPTIVKTPTPTIPHVDYSLSEVPVVTRDSEYRVPEHSVITALLDYVIPASKFGLPSSLTPGVFKKNYTSVIDTTSAVQVPHAEYGVPPVPPVPTPTLNYHLPLSAYALPTYVPPSVFGIDKLLKSPVAPYTFNASPLNSNLVAPVASYLPGYAFSYPHRSANVLPLYNGIQTPSRFSPASYQVPYVPKVEYNLQPTSGKTPSQHLHSLNNLFSTAISTLPSEDVNSRFRVKPLDTFVHVVDSPSPVPQRISTPTNSHISPPVSEQSFVAPHIGERNDLSVNTFYNPGSYYQSLNRNQFKGPVTGNTVLPSAPLLINQKVPPSSNVFPNIYTQQLPSVSYLHPPELGIRTPINLPVNHTIEYASNIGATTGNSTDGATLLIPTTTGERIITVDEELNRSTGDPALVTTYGQPGFSYKQYSHNSPLSLDVAPPKIELTHYDPSFLIVVPSSDEKLDENTAKSDETANDDNSIDVGWESAKIEWIEDNPDKDLHVDTNATPKIDARMESNTLQPLTPVRLSGFNNHNYNPRVNGMYRRRRFRTTQRPITTETVPTTIAPSTIDLPTEDPKSIHTAENDSLQMLQTSSKANSDQSEDNLNDLKYRESTTIVDGRPLILTSYQKPGYSFRIYSKTSDAKESVEIADDKINLDKDSIIGQLGTTEPPNASTEPLFLKQDVNEFLVKSETTHGSPVPPKAIIIPAETLAEQESELPNQGTTKPPRGYSRRALANNLRTSRGKVRRLPEKENVETVPTEEQ